MRTERQTVMMNIGSTVTQIAVNAFCIFMSYRLITISFGIAVLGILSIVNSISTLARFSDFGLGTAIIRNVAKHSSQCDKRAIVQNILGGLLLTAAASLFLCSITVGVSGYISTGIFGRELYVLGKHLVVQSIIALCLLSVASIFLGSLDGVRRTYVRNAILSLGSLTYLASTYLVSRNHDPNYLGYAPIAQGIVILLTSIIAALAVFRFKTADFDLPNRAIFRDLMFTGTHVQASSILSILTDPVTKLTLKYFGGIEFVGYYEIASRFAGQVRNLVANANQIFLPYFSSSPSDENTKTLLRQGEHITDTVALSLFLVTNLASSIIFEYVASRPTAFLMISGYILSFAFLINSMAGPAFYFNLGSGAPQRNTSAQLLISVLNILLSLSLGWLVGPLGVVAGYAAAIAAGSVYLIVRTGGRQRGIGWCRIRPLGLMPLSCIPGLFYFNLGGTAAKAAIYGLVGIAFVHVLWVLQSTAKRVSARAT